MEGASDDGGPTDVEGASDGGYSTVDTAGGGTEWIGSPTTDGSSEQMKEGAAAALSWPARWQSFGRHSKDSGGGTVLANGPPEVRNGHVQNGKQPTMEPTARQLASKGPHSPTPA